ncbi:MAG: hypothetical protein JWO67_43 [Streptosporangiaceae bacterium]|nr:hypothetical protein [Streptosporangiaceae bacterium]
MVDKTSVTERCTATSKRTRGRCGQLVPGGGVCRWHGGAAPQVARHREARLAVAQARDLFADRFEAREWWEALPAAAALCDQLMQALRDKVEMAGTLTVTELEGLAQLTERVARIAKLVQDSDIDERRAALSERQGTIIADAVQGIVEDLGHDLSSPEVMRVVSTRLSALISGDGL